MNKFERAVQKSRQLHYKDQANYRTAAQRKARGIANLIIKAENCAECTRGIPNHNQQLICEHPAAAGLRVQKQAVCIYYK